jgi:hypothetical protein
MRTFLRASSKNSPGFPLGTCGNDTLRARAHLRNGFFLLLFSTFSVPLFAQESELVAGAKKEKTVSLYTSMEARESRLIADAFSNAIRF